MRRNVYTNKVNTERQLRALYEKVHKVFKEAFIEWELKVKDKILRATPMDSGALRASYQMTEHSPKEFSISMGAGLPYAVIVHEWPNENINWTTKGTKSHYLELPVKNNIRHLTKLIREKGKFPNKDPRKK